MDRKWFKLAETENVTRFMASTWGASVDLCGPKGPVFILQSMPESPAFHGVNEYQKCKQSIVTTSTKTEPRH